MIGCRHNLLQRHYRYAVPRKQLLRRLDDTFSGLGEPSLPHRF
jgi:hypothetical protein